MYRLGNRYVLETRNDQDEAAVIIRNVNSDTSIEIPAFRWASFLLLRTDIEEAVGKLLEKKPVAYRMHFGAGWYVSVSTSSGCVDIRQFSCNEHAEIQPTTHGLALEIFEWCHLMNQLLIIMSHEPNLRIARPCSMTEEHISNPNVVLSCRECCPFQEFGNKSGHTFSDEHLCNFVPRFESLMLN